MTDSDAAPPPPAPPPPPVEVVRLSESENPKES